MRLLLIRHGNTFGPGDKVVWVGARTDLPLVEKGCAQAEAVGKALKAAQVTPSRILTGPLLRTREPAMILQRVAGYKDIEIEIDHRLTELDYGSWEGKSSEEIRTLYGPAELTAWEERQEWPQGANFSPPLAEQQDRLDELLGELMESGADDTILIVSSNGIFRLLGQKLAPELTSCKMATGNVSVVDYADGVVSGVRWDMKPGDLRLG